ncbi:hypothetical protein M8C21_030442, partial [Ambrosia artemisiifolia]
ILSFNHYLCFFFLGLLCDFKKMKRLVSFQLIFVTLGFFLATTDAVQPTEEVHALTVFKEVMFLTGFIAEELFQLSFLRELILHGNNLLGSIPKEIGLLNNLKVLDLGGNQLSGPIPHEIGNLVSIVKINLQSNALTGNVPPELGNLMNLQVLRLDRNKLQGIVPGANVTDYASPMTGMYASNTNVLGIVFKGTA